MKCSLWNKCRNMKKIIKIDVLEVIFNLLSTILFDETHLSLEHFGILSSWEKKSTLFLLFNYQKKFVSSIITTQHCFAFYSLYIWICKSSDGRWSRRNRIPWISIWCPRASELQMAFENKRWPSESMKIVFMS